MTPLVAVYHPDPNLKSTLRRGLPAARFKVRSFRSHHRIRQLIQEELIDAVVVDWHPSHRADWLDLAGRYPSVPFFVAGHFRPDDGPLLRECRSRGIAAFLVSGVDDPVVAELVASGSASRRRRAELESAMPLLRLTEQVQLDAWEVALTRAGTKTTTSDVARALGMSREHLSREFAAGGAPNLKRVIDLAKISCAADLLRCPGYTVSHVARILRYASPSHLAEGARRISGARPTELVELGPRGVLARFLKGRTRSRL